ncbi:hypothetical protein BDV59DRAFT_18591 [Aspergillus ambiguus]|uniref:uncharacterized protein n=1 Tax=Aspergillus ambiguus TaxID=176160 RepID=UPI003CCDFCED
MQGQKGDHEVAHPPQSEQGFTDKLGLQMQVKCRDTGDGGCSRCIRLGMTCTFSTVNRRGDQRMQKAHINKHAPSQHSLGWLEPSASSSCKDVEHEEEPVGKDVEKQPGGNNIDENVFRLPFLNSFELNPGDRGSEDASTFALSATLPGTLPELQHISMTRMPGAFLSSPLSSESESQSYLGPTHLPDPSLFDISLPTPASLQTPIYTPLPSEQSGQSCGCLAPLVLAVEQFEASCHSGQRAELDSIVAYQKEAIKRCRAQLECRVCISRREALVLLVFMLEKVVTACGLIVRLYRVKDVPLHLSSSSLQVNGDRSLDISLAPLEAACPISPEWRELLLGDYEISSPLEWEHLVRVLIFLQLRAVMELLADVKSTKSGLLGETLTARLTQAEIRLSDLENYIYIS